MTTLADFNATTARREQLKRRAAGAVEYLLNSTSLRRPVQVDARPEAAFVTVATLIDLLPWLDEIGGSLQVVDLPSGFRVWTLHGQYEWVAGTAVAIRVAAVSPLLDDEVPFELRLAVAS
jgi:hypothetical protein